MLLCVNEFIKRYKELVVCEWFCGRKLLSLECKNTQPTDRFSATFLKNTQERDMSERKENESIQLFLEKEALKSLSRAAEAKRRKQKERTCFFAAFVLPSSAGVQVFH